MPLGRLVGRRECMRAVGRMVDKGDLLGSKPGVRSENGIQKYPGHAGAGHNPQRARLPLPEHDKSSQEYGGGRNVNACQIRRKASLPIDCHNQQGNPGRGNHGDYRRARR